MYLGLMKGKNILTAFVIDKREVFFADE